MTLNKVVVSYFLFMLSIANAQNNKFHIGIEGGPNIRSLISNQQIYSKQSSIGFMAGATVTYDFGTINSSSKEFSKLVSIKTGYYFERKGAEEKTSLANTSGVIVGALITKINYDYLTAPFLFQLKRDGPVVVFFNAGPFVGFLLKQSYNRLSYQNFPALNIDNTSNKNRFDIGFLAGLALSYKISSSYNLTFEVREHLGFLNTTKSNFVKYKTNSINFTFGLVRNLGAQ